MVDNNKRLREENINRRNFLKKTGLGVITATGISTSATFSPLTTLSNTIKPAERLGAQRHSVDKLKDWEAMGYGMFIHFGLPTFTGWPYNFESYKMEDLRNIYNPNRLDVEQWVSVARDSGMKYAVLTAKHQDGFCLWPSEHTNYTVGYSPNQTDIVEKFISACYKKGVKPGLYYCSSDFHHQFGSLNRGKSKRGFMGTFPKSQDEDLPPYTTSVYQTFMTAQITELLTQYGAITEMWIDLPGELGRGYRTYLYNYIAELQPEIFIMMNKGTPDSTEFNYPYFFPTDLLSIERGIPPETGYQKWRMVEDKEYYMPSEVCDTIGKEWFYSESDPPRTNLLEKYINCRERGASLLLNVPPDKRGIIPDQYIQSLKKLLRDAIL